MANEMPRIIDCQATLCAYNRNGKCHTPAVTVGDNEPCCDTFYSNSIKGGYVNVNGGVGACKIQDCKYNDSLECTASGIHMILNKDHADCGTFKPKA